jgi:hypothetical protein
MRDDGEMDLACAEQRPEDYGKLPAGKSNNVH